MKIKCIIKPLIFTMIFVLIFSWVSGVLCRKTIDGAWNYTEKIAGFYNSPENEYDVLFFGSSNTYCSFNPLILYEETGIKSYVLATQLQPVWATFTYMKEALQSQKPKLIVMDMLMFSYTNEYSDEGVNHSYMDDLPFSLNKLELARISAPSAQEQFELICNFVKYHSRWSELTAADLTYDRKKARDYLKGYVLLEQTTKEASPPEKYTDKSSSLGRKQKEYFYKIVDLARENDIPLLFVKTPSNALQKDQKFYNTVFEMAEKEGIRCIDFNRRYDDIAIDMETDFFDKSHLNYKGAEKFSRYFARILTEEYPEISPENTNSTAEMWKKDIKAYYEYCKTIDSTN